MFIAASLASIVPADSIGNRLSSGSGSEGSLALATRDLCPSRGLGRWHTLAIWSN
jgi:hypothetical protein